MALNNSGTRSVPCCLSQRAPGIIIDRRICASTPERVEDLIEELEAAMLAANAAGGVPHDGFSRQHPLGTRGRRTFS